MKINFSAKTIAVYSVNRKAGKSTVAKEMAGFFQIGGKRTLLVDLTLGGGGLLRSMVETGGPDLADWVGQIERRLKKTPWHQIEYSTEEIKKYTFSHATGLNVLTCRQIQMPGRMHEITGVILNSLSQLQYDVIVFDLDSGVRDYIIRVLTSVDTVLLVTDTYRYDVAEVKMVMERLKEGGCGTENFRVVFNKKPSFFDDTPLQVAEEFKLPMAGSLPDYPKLDENFLANMDMINDYSLAMKELVNNII